MSSCLPAIDVRPLEFVHYCIVRADLSHGSQIAQIIHAANESTTQRLPSGSIAVALAAKDEMHLLMIVDALENAGIKHVVIKENDGQAMAIGIEPTTDRTAIRKVTSSIPLVK